ncbi:MAG TPA: serine/threonine-protein kinase, partial [Pirellulaceae bacterium]|nr:serine/threonine-protein kinase [Pirellulaceae bacterium]
MSTDSNKNQTTSLDDVLAAYAELEATGERVDHEAFIARYPDMAEELRAFFDGNELLDMLVHPTTGLEDGSNRLTEMFTGSLLGRFELRREHARGGLGKVWKAHDPLLRREVALKEIREEQAQNPIARHRFLREAQITGQLEHPNIVPVHELGRDSKDDRLFYTMRFVQGDTLREVIESHHRKYGRRAPMSCRRLLNKFVNICEAMAYAHARGVVHRDLKPQNVAIGEFGEVVVMDWGLAKIGDKDDESARTVGISSDAKGQQTVAGHAMGTPAYMAPEQAAGRSKEISSRTAVYGLGAIVFDVLTGSAPHRGPTTDAILQAILNRETPSARERLPTVPRQLEAICGKAMAKQGSDRYGSARDLALDIQHWLDDEPISVCPETLLRRAGRWQRRHRPLVAIALMFALLMGSCIGWLSVANRERFHDKLVQRTAQVEAIRDEVRFALMDGNVEEGLAKYGETLASPQFERSFLQGIADRSNDKNRTLANRLLDALSELAILQVRADLQKAKDVSEANEVQVAATQALELADTWGRAPTAARLFYATFVKREGDNAAELSPDDLKLATTTTLDCFLTGEVARYAGDYEQAIEH